MSGGVDSAVAAGLLLEEGYDVTGVFLCLKHASVEQGGAGEEGSDAEPARARGCCSPQDAADAQRVAETLGIELISLPVATAFEPIIKQFVSEYANGRTPNPCVLCNSVIKFGRLFDLADSLGARYVASGHYARIVCRDGMAGIARARCRGKDQSYALFGVVRRRIERMLLPIGELGSKGDTRALAGQMGLAVHDKADSQEVCFVPDNDYTLLLARRVPEALRGGEVVNSAGEVLGMHDGYARFTVGQRRGVGVAAGVPMYVTDIDPESARVTIGPREAVMRDHLRAGGVNWQADVGERFSATVQIRYNHEGVRGVVRRTGPDSFKVAFEEAVLAITPGQAAVVYDGEQMLGGGWIESDT